MDPILKLQPENVWFTSDTHFGHENIIRFCNRPFINAAEMNAELIRRWRETVPDDGIIFHLGDFAHGSSRLWNDILNALPGHKYLILGNHDMKAIRQGFMSHFELVTQQMTIRVGGQAIVLNHNPFLCYGGSYRDVWQLFGHVHSGPASHTGLDHPRLKMLFPRQYDVGVDNNDYRPISFADVKAKIEAQVAAAKAAIGIKDDVATPEVRRIVFVDKGADIGLVETARIREIATDIIELDSSIPIKEAIAARVSLLTGNIRYVYVGSRPLDDFRYVPIKTGTPITMASVEAAVKIL
ncbi:MAG: metallophosphoesterase [Prevotella sp.]|nr:metallophosphoesterase [Prevotella sp.]